MSVASLLLDPASGGNCQVRKQELEPGKFLAVRGYVVEEDTLICRTPEKERELARLLIQAKLAFDELELLRTMAAKHSEQTEILRTMISRRDYIIQQQDSLIQRLEKLASPGRSSLAAQIGRIFDRRTFFLLGFVLGVYAGVQLD